MKISSPSRNTSARNPSHLGSKIHSSPDGRSATRLASIGSTGGLTGRRTPQVRTAGTFEEASVSSRRHAGRTGLRGRTVSGRLRKALAAVLELVEPRVDPASAQELGMGPL